MMNRKETIIQNNILRDIGTIARALDSISNIEFKDIELAKGQYLYLSRIFENPGINQKQISELLCVDKSTASRAINQLVEKKLIQKVEDVNNKKNKLLYVTPYGEEVYPVIFRELQYSTQIALQGLDELEIAQINILLSKVSQNIKENWIEVKKGEKRIY
ncbi:MarR family winged helix-turn-helix transcriptional regulator [Lactococcus garvieae]|uniref:MarR family winged helix-turn-helix transcriptional regulator n=1 Tax=Lactococcus garvieae TaxID=1363 RepID=UPI0018D9B3B7|nr:MarR family transcriptional regulator [Lactococcus garvieae]QPS71726.1 MarR family transcriptional regulator [Lactococcus garvieae]